MKNYVLSLLACSFFAPLYAQYDFPATINGISIGLNLNGEQTVHATDFLSIPTDPCSNFGEVLINRSTLQFPRGSEPPASASDSLVFNCTDFSTESVEIWYQDRFGNWLVSDSYVVIFGLDADCGSCEGDDCPSSSPQLYNGYSISFPGGNDNVTVNARELVSRSIIPGETFSFSPLPTDSIQVFSCSDNSLVPVLIYSHLEGFTSRPASTYITLAIGENCGNGDFTGAASRVMQGLSVPNSSAEIVTVPASAFAPRNGPAQQLSFSENPADTLFSLTCEQIGAGGIFFTVYNHVSGAPGPPALTYLTGDDTQNHCEDGPENTAANDSIVNALVVDSCRTFHQFTKASTEEEDILFPGSGQSVWHFTAPISQEDGASVVFQIDAKDTIRYALFESGFLLDTFFSVIDTGTIIGLDTLAYYDCIINNRLPASITNIYLQISGISENSPSRYYLSVGQMECPSATTERNLATPVLAGSKDLKSYPNPTTGLTSIDVPEGLSSQATIRIFDQTGRRIQQFANNNFSDKINLDLADHPSGIYYVRLNDTGKTWMGKIVLNR